MAKEPLILDGTYRLLRPAGTGATSNVFLAEEVATGKPVAVKVLKRAYSADPDMLARFDREAKLLATLRHPNIVGLIQFVRAPEGVVLLLEWVEGTRIDVLLEAAPFSAERSMRVLRQLAQALAATHAAGIVHRDLKPENVMLDSRDVVRLLDFGIARFTDQTRAAQVFLTAAGQGAGTPAFISPEQAQGLPADPRSDIYSFGVLAYRLLAGVLPFRGPSDVEFLDQHVHDRPRKLKLSDSSWSGADLSPLVMRCLEKKPSARFRDGKELFEAFEQLTHYPPKRRRLFSR